MAKRDLKTTTTNQHTEAKQQYTTYFSPFSNKQLHPDPIMEILANWPFIIGGKWEGLSSYFFKTHLEFQFGEVFINCRLPVKLVFVPVYTLSWSLCKDLQKPCALAASTGNHLCVWSVHV